MSLDQRHILGEQFARQHNQTAVLDQVLRGERFITHGQQDGDLLAWLLAKRQRELTDHIGSVKIEENHHRADGLVEEVWGDERPVVVHGNPGVHPTHCSFYIGDQMTTDWKFAILNPDNNAMIQIICHESRWDAVVAALRERGFWVVNGDAPYTHPSQKWTDARQRERVEVAGSPRVQAKNLGAFVSEQLCPMPLAGLVRCGVHEAVPRGARCGVGISGMSVREVRF